MGAASIAGCAGDGGLSMTTGSLNDTTKTASSSKPKLKQECVALIAQIDALRKEGTPERIKKVSTGKSKTVVIKRSALVKVSELDKANSEYQSKCSAYSPSQLRAQAAAQGLTSFSSANKSKTTTTSTKKTSSTKPAKTTKKKIATATPTPTAPKTTTAVKKTVTIPKKAASLSTASKTASKKKTVTLITKSVTAVKKSSPITAQKKAPVQLMTRSQAGATQAAKSAATSVNATVKTAAATAKTAVKNAKTTATTGTKATTKAEENFTFPPFGASGLSTVNGGNAVVTTTVPVP